MIFYFFFLYSSSFLHSFFVRKQQEKSSRSLSENECWLNQSGVIEKLHNVPRHLENAGSKTLQVVKHKKLDSKPKSKQLHMDSKIANVHIELVHEILFSMSYPKILFFSDTKMFLSGGGRLEPTASLFGTTI